MAGQPVTPISELITERLTLRQWSRSDREPFAAMNADPQVMEHFPKTMTRAESDHLVDRIVEIFDTNGYGMWAVEITETAEFIGFIGIHPIADFYPFAPAVEIGWRLARRHWGKGYATEGAKAAVRAAFEQLGLTDLVSFTAVGNLPSQAVMRRIGMTRDVDADFDHPKIAVGSPVRPHVLYRLTAQAWRDRLADQQPD